MREKATQCAMISKIRRREAEQRRRLMRRTLLVKGVVLISYKWLGEKNGNDNEDRDMASVGRQRI